jgi:hypothetical protein
MAFFAIGPSTNGPAMQPDLCIDDGQESIGSQQLQGPDAHKVPTLAPPRDSVPSISVNSLNPTLIGQTVYVQVETDRVEIEVGWANSELLGR